MKPVIEVSGISKSYQISHQSSVGANYGTLKDDFAKLIRKPFGGTGREEQEIFWALKDINFTVNKGEAFGIIGRNGSGKSTMLKILSRIVDPTAGSVKIHGKVASLLEVGTGFHPELTGRENIFFNGSMLGMSKQEISSKFNEIVEFSGVEKFLDTPVKFYSSGMYVRLAFSVAAHLDPEILILDEVLAVGDAQFQKKSLEKMVSIAKSGRTIIFVSHGLTSVEKLCDRAMWLQNGKIKMIGDTQEVIEKYVPGATTKAEQEAFIAAKKEEEISQSPQPGIVKKGDKLTVRAAKHVFSEFKVNGQDLGQPIVIDTGVPIQINAVYKNTGLPRDLLIGFGIKSNASKGFPVFVHNELEGVHHTTGESGQIEANLSVPRLSPGKYDLEIHVWLDRKVFLEGAKIGDFNIRPTTAFAAKEELEEFPSEILVDSSWKITKD